MEKSNNGLLIGLIAVAVILMVVTIFGVYSITSVDEQALSDKVTAQVIKQIPVPEKVNVPTAAEIAALITVPSAPEVVVPEFKSDSHVQDLWENLYGDEIDELETEAYDVAELELEDHDYKLLTKWLESSIEGFDELEDVDVKDYDITIVELGLDEDEDKIATVEFELKVKYSLLEGADDNFKKTVFATATVSFDEGDYDDEDVEFVFA